MDARNLADLYDLPIVDWARVRDGLDQGIDQAPGTAPGRDGPNRHTCWLATINPHGSPHVTGVGALWVDGEFWFETGEGSRKGRNLGRRIGDGADRRVQRTLGRTAAVARVPPRAPRRHRARHRRSRRRDQVPLLGEFARVPAPGTGCGTLEVCARAG